MITRIISKFICRFIKLFSFVNVRLYMKYYVKYLQAVGVKIPNYDGTGFIAASAYLDGANYNLISIGRDVTLSTGVLILVHDYSISRGIKVASADFNYDERYVFMKNVSIGDGAFVGARSIILPGAKIGNNTIIGAGSVVHGEIPSSVIAAGNPARVIADLKEWGERHIIKDDFEVYKRK